MDEAHHATGSPETVKEIKDIVNDSAEFAKESPEPALDQLWTDIYAEDLPQGSATENA